MKRAWQQAVPDWAEHALAGDLFSSGPWFRHFECTALNGDEMPVFLECQTPQSPAGLALKATRASTFPRLRVLESMANYYSCGFGPIGATPPDAATLQALAQRLGGAARAFDAVRISPVDRAAPFATACQDALSHAGYRTFWTLSYRNWYAATEGMDYRRYLGALSSSFPATSEKRRQAYLRKHPGSISILSAAGAQLEGAIDDYQRVYHSSWKQPEPHGEFIPGLIRLAASHGWLRLGVLSVDGVPAAAQLWFVVDGRALIYKVAYDERFSKLSVGSMLTCALLEHVLNVDRVRELDFLSGDDSYKAKWMFARRDRWMLLGFNQRRWRGVVAGLREAVAQRRDAMRRRSPADAQAAGRDQSLSMSEGLHG